MSNKKTDLVQQLKEKAREIDRREEYKSKKTYEKKPRAIRRFEKYSNMSDDKNKNE